MRVKIYFSVQILPDKGKEGQLFESDYLEMPIETFSVDLFSQHVGKIVEKLEKEKQNDLSN